MKKLIATVLIAMIAFAAFASIVVAERELKGCMYFR